MGLAIVRNGISSVLGIQAFDFAHIDIADIGYLLKVQATVHLYGIYRAQNIDFHGTDVMLVVISYYIIGGNESGYVSSCFSRQMTVDFPIARFAACTSGGFVGCSRAAIVDSNHQAPVLADGIYVFEITCGNLGSFNRVTAFVH